MKEKLNDWWSTNTPREELIYGKGLDEQCIFVRNQLAGDLFLRYETDYCRCADWSDTLNSFTPYVIGTHVSKSVCLPVFELCLPRCGLTIILRNNFYDWCISVESKKDVVCDFTGLSCMSGRKGYFEGFPNDRIYQPYSSDNRKNFSAVLDNDYEVYTFMFILRSWAIREYGLEK